MQWNMLTSLSSRGTWPGYIKVTMQRVSERSRLDTRDSEGVQGRDHLFDGGDSRSEERDIDLK